MAQIFPKWTNDIPKIAVPVTAILGGFAVFVVWYWFSPLHTDVGYGPKQPIPYSHELHAGHGTGTLVDGTVVPALGLDCRYCHNNVERSANAGVPPTQTCMNCHKQVKLGSLALAPLYKSWGDGKEEHDGGGVPWVRIHKIPDYAYFNHSAHVGIKHQGAAIGCVTCHGRVDTMKVVHQQQPLSMSWCLDCHNNPAPNLRPISEVTNMSWRADEAWMEKAKEIASHLTPPGNKNVRTQVPDSQCTGFSDEEKCSEGGCFWEHGHCKGGEIVHAMAGCTGCHR